MSDEPKAKDKTIAVAFPLPHEIGTDAERAVAIKIIDNYIEDNERRANA